jgi:signal transduction protein with GAF and PtsI domain
MNSEQTQAMEAVKHVFRRLYHKNQADLNLYGQGFIAGYTLSAGDEKLAREMYHSILQGVILELLQQ